jgi:high-affinity iron transporter
MRTILICSLTVAGLLPGRVARSQETPGRRLAGVVAVAMSEYRLGVGADGKVLSRTELEEARAFFGDARDVAARLTGSNAKPVSALVDSLATAVKAARGTRSVDSLYARFVIALGSDAALAPASRHVDLIAGARLYEKNCAQCHGAVGLGDGPAGRGLLPPPARLAGDSARDIAPSLLYRVVSVGVKGTAMPSWADSLTVDQRWDVVAYVGSLRGTHAADAGRGMRDAKAVEASVTRFLDSALAAARAGRAVDAADGAFDAYAAFEPLETIVRPRNPALVTRLEGEFLAFRTAVKNGDLARADSARARVLADLPTAVASVAGPASPGEAFAMSFVIILREGFEAILIIGAIVAMLIRTGNAGRVRDVWFGALLGIGASGVVAFALQTTLRSLNANPEVIEGATLLLAVAVLFSVSYWILSKVEADRWQTYVRQRVDAAIGRGGRAALVTVAFLVVFREGAETALFFQPLLQDGSRTMPILGGLATGTVALAVVYVLVNRFGVRLPLRTFFGATGGLLYAMGVVFMGKGLRELQEGGVLSNTPLRIPTVESLGIYPSVETVAGQALLLCLFAFACWFSFVRPRLGPPRKSPASPDRVYDGVASTPARIPQTPSQSPARP